VLVPARYCGAQYLRPRGWGDDMRGSCQPRSTFLTKLCGIGAALYCGALIFPTEVVAQSASNDPANYAWQAGAIRHAQQMRAFFDVDKGQQPTPPVIPRFELNFDTSGLLGTFQPGGPTQTSQNPFFQNLGTNGRTCFTCHQQRLDCKRGKRAGAFLHELRHRSHLSACRWCHMPECECLNH